MIDCFIKVLGIGDSIYQLNIYLDDTYERENA